MAEALANWLFDPSGLTPHGFCLSWDPWLIWLHAGSDLTTGAAYLAIPVMLYLHARRRRDIVRWPVLWLFAGFIVLCGSGHWLDLATLWIPLYGLEGLVKALTAVVSVVAAVAIWMLLPRAFAWPSARQYREATEALHQSHARAVEYERAFFNDSHDALAIVDVTAGGAGPHFTYMGFNAVSERVTGLKRRDVVGFSPEKCMSPVLADCVTRHYRTCIAAGAAITFEDTYDLPVGIREFEGYVSPIRDPSSGTIVRLVVATRDVTERNRMSEALRQAQKMEALGTLTGGVAHDFNNVLACIVINLELLERRLRHDQQDLVTFTKRAQGAAGRAAKTVEQLLTFSGNQRLEAQPVDTSSVVEGSRAMLAQSAGDNIRIMLDEPDRPIMCVVDRNQLENALLNLVLNSRDAMGPGGTIRITVRVETLGHGAPGDPAPGEYARIAVTDDGCGMSSEVAQRAFEPFFTTKRVGRGTGLGLAQVHGFARHSGGTATIRSALDQGTEVALFLPLAPPGTPVRSGETPWRERDVAGAARRSTVLLVEDDEGVRLPIATLLADLGYLPIAIENADAAIAIIESGVAVDAVLTDLAMPGTLDGLGLLQLVRATYPNLATVLMTGIQDARRVRFVPDEVELLRKPFGPDQLLQALRRAARSADNTGDDSISTREAFVADD